MNPATEVQRETKYICLKCGRTETHYFTTEPGMHYCQANGGNPTSMVKLSDVELKSKGKND